MPTIRLSAHTMQLVRERAPATFRFACIATKVDDVGWTVPVDDAVAYRIALMRLPGESDDDVVSRLVREAVERKPD
jgi:hypothetical protein